MVIFIVVGIEGYIVNSNVLCFYSDKILETPRTSDICSGLVGGEHLYIAFTLKCQSSFVDLEVVSVGTLLVCLSRLTEIVFAFADEKYVTLFCCLDGIPDVHVVVSGRFVVNGAHRNLVGKIDRGFLRIVRERSDDYLDLVCICECIFFDHSVDEKFHFA